MEPPRFRLINCVCIVEERRELSKRLFGASSSIQFISAKYMARNEAVVELSNLSPGKTGYKVEFRLTRLWDEGQFLAEFKSHQIMVGWIDIVVKEVCTENSGVIVTSWVLIRGG